MKPIKLVLREDVKGLGKKGEAVSVSEGYARNFLLPRNLAAPATEGKLRETTLIQDGRLKKEARLQQDAEKLGIRLQGLALTIAARTGESGKLYGAVTGKDISQELEKVLGRPFDKRKLEMTEPIKTLGEFQVPVRLHPGLVVSLKVTVTAGA